MTKNIEAWEESSVADEFHVQLGKRLDAAVNRGELKQCINNRGVRWGRVLTSEAVLAPLTQSDIRDLRLASGDVLVCEGGEIGRSSVWNGEIPEAYFLNTLHRLRPKSQYEPRLLVGVLEHWAKTGKLSALAGKSSLAHLTKENLLRVRIPVPPLIEQKQIVDSLLVIDELIATLERMISKKQEIKQSLMQQLLTGETRLPGFTGPWKPLQIAANSTLKARIGWQGLTTAEYRRSGSYRLVGGTNFRDGSIAWDQTPFVDRERYEQDPYIQLRPGDVLLTKDGSIGKTAYVDMTPGPATLNSGIFVIRPIHESYDSKFLYFMFRSRAFEDFLSRLSAGSTISHLYQRDLATLTLDMPPTLEEQRRITTILADAESEITALQVRLKKAHHMKSGMMQELLTGRTRLPPKENTA